MEEDDVYLAEIIGERTTKGGRKKYHVRWIGYPLEQAQRLGEKDVTNELITEFREKQALRKQTTTTLHLEGVQVDSPADAPSAYKVKVPNRGQTRERPVLYISRNTKPFECAYESTQRELTCVVWAFVKLRHLLKGSQTIIVTDHTTIREVVRSAVSTQYSLRIDKFRMLLAPFIEVFYRPGKAHKRRSAITCSMDSR